MENNNKQITKEDVSASSQKLGACVCPICGRLMDDTEYGRQYCWDCEQLLKGDNL